MLSKYRLGGVASQCAVLGLAHCRPARHLPGGDAVALGAESGGLGLSSDKLWAVNVWCCRLEPWLVQLSSGLQRRVGGRADMRVDAFQVAQDVQM